MGCSNLYGPGVWCGLDDETTTTATTTANTTATTTTTAVDTTGASQTHGEHLLVITDVGYDDNGAITHLSAANRHPSIFLTANGLSKPSNSTRFLQGLLNHLEVEAAVYQGKDDCYNDCPKPWAFLEELVAGYTANERTTLGRFEEDGEIREDFDWKTSLCSTRARWTVLSLAPLSELDHALKANPGLTRCISRVIAMGGYVGTKEFQRIDPVTDHQAVIRDGSDYTWGAGEDPTESMELNLWTDPVAASNVVASGLDLTLIPLNVASADPFGVDGQKTTMLEQCQREREAVDALKAIEPKSAGARKLQEIVLKHKQCVQWGEGGDDFGSTGGMLDMDVIAATYLWQPRLFDLAPQVLVAVDPTNGRLLHDCFPAPHQPHAGQGIPCRCGGNPGVHSCGRVNLASKFQARGWLAELTHLLTSPARS